jgi:hypothetical protein
MLRPETSATIRSGTKRFTAFPVMLVVLLRSTYKLYAVDMRERQCGKSGGSVGKN